MKSKPVDYTNPNCLAAAEALGLKNVISLDIHIAVNELVSVTVKYHPDENDIDKLFKAGVLKAES
jgi:hypothetical protein